ncbi:hypothetical protein O988_04935 [Pseudogymnoascus sp. VKM F-3808]|nr:hypothetical protein O988_04935 [Pseudogymnoascus sp. VKM F-3808]
MPLAPLAQSVRQALVVSRLEILDVTSTKHFEQHITFVQTKASREDADSKYLDNALKTENEKIYTREWLRRGGDTGCRIRQEYDLDTRLLRLCQSKTALFLPCGDQQRDVYHQGAQSEIEMTTTTLAVTETRDDTRATTKTAQLNDVASNPTKTWIGKALPQVVSDMTMETGTATGARAHGRVADLHIEPPTTPKLETITSRNHSETIMVAVEPGFKRPVRYSQRRGDSHKSERDIERSQPPVEEPPSDTEPLDEAALIEQRRKRREAIKAKYKGSATPLMVQALQIGDRATPETRSQSEQDGDDNQPTRNASPDVATPSTPKEIQDPSAFTALNDQELANNAGGGANPEDGPSAADYDPTMDMKEDRFRDDKRHTEDVPSSAYDETKPTREQEVLLPVSVQEAEEKPKKSKDDFDMFADDDDDDMFAEEPETTAGPTHKTGDVAVAVPIPEAKVLNVGMLDNWDDAEGYYKVILGELLDGKYHVQANLGKGMFSGVVRATDITTKKLVAVKMIRANETMRKAGMKEIEILQKLMDADADDKKHMIRLERHFEHKGHLCMVFEHLSINLREVLKKFGRDVGINIRAVRVYAQQMFLGLTLMRKCNILHADLKPDNILVNENRSMLKICDLGSASDASDNEITPYLVSRFYRAPEIILGMPYDFAIDIWSVGCTLYELYTGKILFVGRSNNQMLRSIMECRGKFTTKMLRKAQFAHMHFDEQTNFLSVEQDKLSGRDTVKTLPLAKPTRDLRTRLASGAKGLPDDEAKELNLFIDLLDKCLALNPEKRCTPAEALKHPFLNRPVGR